MMILFKALVCIGALVYFIGAVPFYYVHFLCTQGKSKSALTFLSRHFASWCLFLFRIRVISINREIVDQIDWTRPVFFVGNHQSYTDIPVLLKGANHHLGFLAKKELDKIPLLGFWIKQGGGILIDRKKFLATLKTIQRLAQAGRIFHIVVFPEGTRSKDGQIADFKTGGLSVAWNLEAQVIPFYIENSRSAWEDRKGYASKNVEIRFAPIVDWKEAKTESKLDEAVLNLRNVVLKLESEAKNV